ncbi:MAG: DUF72 domain-containing protein [Proteobacteria bacterium]|nr:DUF72 domain-containing protein [Pseudomonadota bacterium]
MQVGCSGWYYQEWEGLFYPENLDQYFSYYAKFFNTVEINNTFYRFPSNKTVQRWYQQAPQGFKYSLKVSRYITHFKKFQETEEALQKFYNLSHILKDKMGCFLFQLPKNYRYSVEHLQRLLLNLDTNYENVIEFRHKSWWNTDVFEAFRTSNITFCTVSGLDVPEDLIALNEHIYIRFHGNATYDSSYCQEELSLWVNKIHSCTLTLKNFWAYFNNDRYAYAPQNAFLFSHLLDL